MEIIPGLPNDVAFECLIRISFDQFHKAASVSRAWNAVIKQPEFHRRREVSGLTRPVIVMAQSMDGLIKSNLFKVYRLTLFEPVKRRWRNFPPIPEMVEGMPVCCGVAGIGPELVVIGGCDPMTRRVQGSVFIYNFISATWRRGADMPGEDRLFFGCAGSAEDGTVVVAGGHNGDNMSLKSTLAYDVARDTWTTLPDMSIGRNECTCVFHHGKFHVLGGYNMDTQEDSKQPVETLDLVTREWQVINDTVTDYAIISAQATYVEIDGVIYTIKGKRDVVALEDATWVFVSRVPNNTSGVAYVTGWQGKMMVIIENAENGRAKRAYVLELKTKKWTKVKIPSEFRGYVECGCCIHI
nr:F-box/kelch-repeat protein At1g80440-like [Ipomoea batatas]